MSGDDVANSGGSSDIRMLHPELFEGSVADDDDAIEMILDRGGGLVTNLSQLANEHRLATFSRREDGDQGPLTSNISRVAELCATDDIVPDPAAGLPSSISRSSAVPRHPKAAKRSRGSQLNTLPEMDSGKSRVGDAQGVGDAGSDDEEIEDEGEVAVCVPPAAAAAAAAAAPSKLKKRKMSKRELRRERRLERRKEKARRRRRKARRRRGEPSESDDEDNSDDDEVVVGSALTDLGSSSIKNVPPASSASGSGSASSEEEGEVSAERIVKDLVDEVVRSHDAAQPTQRYLRLIPPNGLLNLVDHMFLKLGLVTYNLHGKVPPKNTRLDEVFPADLHHIVAVASQECERTIKKSFFMPGKRRWVKAVIRSLSLRYTLCASATLTGMHLGIFVRKELKRYISNVECFTIPCGLFNFFGNEGGVAVGLQFGHTTMLFIGAHLTHGQKGYKARNRDYRRILDYVGSKMRTESNDVFERFDHVFFFGDLNYRIDGEDALVRKLIEVGMKEVLLANDQLARAKKEGLAWTEFREEPITFLPTFKFLDGKNEYDRTSTPAFCDRILYQSRKEIRCLEYGALHDILFSDHHPVFARFLIEVDAIPLPPPDEDEDFEDPPDVARRRHKTSICSWF